LKIIKSKLIQIIKEELDKEAVRSEKEAAVDSLLGSRPLTIPQLELLFPNSEAEDIKNIETELKKFEEFDREGYREALLDLLYQQKPIDPEGNPLEFSS